ncbi:PHD finger protein 14 [Pseudorasbora parva]|uniref:PHD finger protein 14 n=1 Tax=Pseudorasbora parva TaxID=51549 RepID=UPI00351E5BD4
MDRGSKRRQVKPLADSLLDALDYDSSDDSDFEVGDASGSEGTGKGTDEEGSNDSAAGSESDSDAVGSADEEGIDEEETKDLNEDTEEEEKAKEQSCSEETSSKETGGTSKNRRKGEKSSDTEPNGSGTAEEGSGEPKKWNLRRNRPMLDFTTMEELNEMDDYDSEDDNDWRPTQGKKKGKASSGKEQEGSDEEDDGGSDEEDNEDEENETSSSDSEEEGKKPKRKSGKNTGTFDEEETNDSHSTSHGKGNEDSLLERPQTWSSQRMEHILICCVCLGDNSEDADEIIQCDNCGVTVHEVCGGSDLAYGLTQTLKGKTIREMRWRLINDQSREEERSLLVPECSLCEDARFARTGVCISCDAGMCRSFFHVTCAQREGLLSEAAAEEDIADPFFAYCKQHADRFDRKWKRKNYLALQSYCKVSLQEREKQLTPEAQARITTRLQQYRAKAELSRNTRPQAWVPREKLPRPLTSSASAIRKLMRKAELMGISTDIFPVDTSDTSASVDGRRKHKQPALTADFVNYYLERNMRMIQIQDNIVEQKNLKDKLESEQEKLHMEYDKLCESLEDLQNVNGQLRTEGQAIWSMMGGILGQKLNTPAVLKAPKERKPSKKEGGSPGKSSNLPTMLYSCGICKKNQDQHLLLLCDTCKLHYHLGCLDPPLTRMPKKTKNSYWQCSECDQASSDEADIAMETLPDGTKRSRRQIKGPIKFIPQEMSPEPKKLQVRGTRTRGQKRKRTSIYEEEKIEEPSPRERRQRQSTLQKKPKADDTRTECTTCKGPGDNENLVRCDECQLCYHFGCLDPPLKKSPKQTGYGWICQECDTSSSKEEDPQEFDEESVKDESADQEIPD